jgi:hypothetical protein
MDAGDHKSMERTTISFIRDVNFSSRFGNFSAGNFIFRSSFTPGPLAGQLHPEL